MSLFRVKTTECRVGVVGLYGSGKTALLTSVVNHLEDHDPDRFRLGPPGAQNPVRLRKFRALPPDPGWSAFPFAAFRDALVHRGKWPAKTTDRAEFVCQFERSDWDFSDVLLKLLDLPGERFADAAMLDRNFADWSDHVLGLMRDDAPYRTCCEPFLLAAEHPGMAEPDLLRAYKLALAKLILQYKPLISPSTFLLDTKGRLAAGDDPAVLAGERFAGLAPGAEFAPLPATTRASRPDLAGVFASRYEAYKEAVVNPFLGGLRSCHALIVLLDVTTILAAGVGMYNDTRDIVKSLFAALRPGESPLEWAGRRLAYAVLPHEWRPAGITRVAFVAPKLDLIHPADRDRVPGLLQRMVGRMAGDCDGLRYEFFNVASAVSTRVLPTPPGDRQLVGVPYRDADGRRVPPGPEQRFAVSAVPDHWPTDWAAGQFVFPDVYPSVPALKDCPPEQVNLDRLVGFVLG